MGNVSLKRGDSSLNFAGNQSFITHLGYFSHWVKTIPSFHNFFSLYAGSSPKLSRDTTPAGTLIEADMAV
jgi:hypothetical protein